MAAREDLGGIGGFPPPAAELDALGLEAAVPFFTIIAGGGAGGQVFKVVRTGSWRR